MAGIGIGSVKGINLNKIDAMIDSIAAYEKAIDSCKISVSTTHITKAIQGSNAVKNCQTLASTIDAKIDEYTNILEKYRQRLTDVKSAYVSNDQAASQTFADGIQAIKNKKS